VAEKVKEGAAVVERIAKHVEQAAEVVEDGADKLITGIDEVLKHSLLAIALQSKQYRDIRTHCWP
jgi:hypothetical protein